MAGSSGRHEALTAPQREFLEDNVAAGYFHSNIIRRLAPRLRRIDRESVDSAVHLALAKAVSTWDPAKGSFSHWCSYFVRHELQTELRSSMLVKPPRWYSDNDSSRRTGSGHAEAACRTRRLLEPPATPGVDIEGISRSEIADRVGRVLCPGDADVIRRVYFGGETIAEVAAARGVTRQRIQMIHARAIERLRSNLDPDDW